ncbi:MAG: FHA domain-containing protein [Dehalococcoidia bacterium]|nr:FHA domain-containing protein [Dehalococcoidia bacterium]
MKAVDKVAKLVIRSHGGSEYEIPLDRNRVQIGRSKDSEVILDDEFASRNHAAIERRGDRYFICDGGSTNGTLIKDEHVRGDRQLRNGDEIRIGETELTFREETSGQSTTKALQPPSEDQLKSPVQVDTLAWEVWVDGKRLGQKLSVLEFKLLGYLYGRANAVCARDEIGTELWGDGAYTHEMLHQLVHRLKRRLEPNPAIPRYIVSVPGVGYRLACTEESPE